MRHYHVLALLVATGSGLLAQVDTATLSGSVTDASGSVLIGAIVQLSQLDTNITQSTRTNTAGIYSFSSLPPGPYRASVTNPGFKVSVKEGLVLHVQDTAVLNFKMELGAVTESVTVSADAMVLDTVDANVGMVVERQVVANMPLNGRSFQGLITLTPGVSTVSTGINSPGQFVVNGQRADTNYFSVDGVSANVASPVLGSVNANGTGSSPTATSGGGFNSMVSIDALQEFRISTSSFAPEFGRTPGAQISLSSRSGTNAVHGDVFDYLRNTVLDANDWFLNAQGKPRGVVQQNDFGGVAGGPIKRDKLFFFVSYEGLRLQSPSPAVKPVPTQSARTLAASTTDNGVVGYMAQFLTPFPLPDGNPSTPCTSANTCVANVTATQPGTSQLDAVSGRLDYSLNSHMNLFGRFSHSPSNTSISTTVTQSSLNGANDVYTAGWTAAIGGSMSNDLHFNFTHTTFLLGVSAPTFQGSLSSIFPSGFAQPPSNYTLQQMAIQFTGYPGGVDSLTIAPASAYDGNDQINITDSFSYTKGSHRFRFGVDFRQLNPSWDQSNFNAGYTFAGTNNCPGGTPAYICGIASVANIQHNIPQHFRIREWSSYAQDTWKLTQRLTLTYGLRWEINPPMAWISNNPGYSIDPKSFNLATLKGLEINPLGTPAFPPRWGNVSPRVGVAWQFSADPKWGRVLRTGYGLFYDTGNQAFALSSNPWNARFNNTIAGVAAVQFPFVDARYATPPPLTTTLPISGGTETVIDPHFNLPYVHQFNVTVEQQLGPNESLSVGYVGAIGRNLLGQRKYPSNLVNAAVFGSNGVGDVLTVNGNYATSDYHSLQSKFQRQFSHSAAVIATYTWSHSIDDQSVNGAAISSLPTAAELTAGLAAIGIRGSSDFDIRQNMGLSVVYDIAAPFARNRVSSAILGHWALAPINHYQTAVPIEVVANTTSTLSAATSLAQRPNLISGVPVYVYGNQYPGGKAFNTAPVSASAAAAAGCVAPTATNAKGAFCTPLPVGTQAVSGDLGRNIARGFSLQELDLSVHRDFPLHESVRLRFQADMFNVFNHPNFGQEGVASGATSANFSNTIFGSATGMANSAMGAFIGNGAGFSPIFNTGGPRNFQFALKLFF